MIGDQDRRALLAIVVSIAIFALYGLFFAPPPPPPPADEPAVEQVAGSDAPAEAPASAAPVELPPPPPVFETVPDHSEEIGGDGWVGAIHSANGALRSLVMSDYSEPPTVHPIWSWVMAKFGGRAEEGWEPYIGGGDPQRLLSDEGALLLAGVDALNDDGAAATDQPSAYRVEAVDGGVRARRVLPNGVSITKTYSPGSSPHELDVSVTFVNNSDQPLQGLWVGVADRMSGEAGRFANAVRPLACVDRDVEHELKLEKVEGEEREVWTGPVDWFGVGDRYFMAVLAPVDLALDEVVVDDLPGGRIGSFAFDDRPLEPGGTRTLEFYTFVGPKNLDLLKPAGHNLELAVEFGVFGFFSKILLFLLKLFQAGVVNWGLSIILLTILVKLAFFPLTQKAFVSSRKMQAIQPLMKAVKEKYKDNRELQTQETMKLMKEHGVNPMGGCLPTLIQLPVWFALYRVMLYSVELYDTSFLYLRDLTAADPFGVLPVMYIILMLVQQRMMPMAGMDPTQAKMMKMMPLVFGFIMFGFPSGLVLYFSVNMMLTTVQQWLIRRNYPDQPAPAAAST